MNVAGYDVIYVDDISATTSPEAAYGMVRYNSNLDGKFSLGHLFILAAQLSRYLLAPSEAVGLLISSGFIGNSSDIIAALS